MRKFLTTAVGGAVALSAWGWAPDAAAQIPYDPPTAVAAPPNVMLLLDATQTTLISGATCSSHSIGCHAYTACAGNQNCDLYRNGETRLTLARRVLTGGWGWRTTATSDAGEVADGLLRQDGVMDTYKVRWGVAWYDGFGTRIVQDPTNDNPLAQQRVIDFGLRPNDTTAGQGLGTPAGGGNAVSLNSYVPLYRSTNCCSNTAVPEANDSGGRQARALEHIRQYWQPGVSPPRFNALTVNRNSNAGAGTFTVPAAPAAPGDATAIDADVSNVLVTSPAAGGCRRNVTIMLLDGHGGGNYDPDGGGPLPAISNGGAAASIYNLPSMNGDNLATTPDRRGRLRDNSTRVFAIHFGSQDKPHADRVADSGFDGQVGGGGLTTSFEGAPGGAVTSLEPILAAFAAVMGLVLDGDYVGAAPSVSRFGEWLIQSQFSIRGCEGVSPTQCNIGRPGALRMFGICQPNDARAACSGLRPGQQFGPIWDAGTALRLRNQSSRSLLTGRPSGANRPTEINCTTWATCGSLPGGQTSARMTNIPDPGDPSQFGSRPRPTDLVTLPLEWSTAATGIANMNYNDLAFIRGDPNALFANTVFRGDGDCGQVGGTCCVDTNLDGIADNPRCLDNQYKLADIANSKPVIVGGPGGLGADLDRWNFFLDLNLARGSVNVPAYSGSPFTRMQVRNRDQVVYVGGNDGFVHAFLAGVALGPNDPRPDDPTQSGSPAGRAVAYRPVNSTCTGARTWCDGQELWAYSPKLLQRHWKSLQAGHFFMVDGSPVVSDVLFTHGNTTPPAQRCHRRTSATCRDWEYRTVLLQCLGAGGPGCFAMDVTNPYDPQLLWEREFTAQIGQRSTSTSRPQIIRVKRQVTTGAGITFDLPYYVGAMGGGLNETRVNLFSRQPERRGSFVVMGLEDGRVFTSAGVADADFAGAPTCLDTDNDSFADTCYIATTTAELWKIRFTNGDPSQGITMVKFFDGRRGVADTVGGTPTIGTYHRVVATFDVDGGLLLFYGTGDFEDVRNATEQNYFFKVRDSNPSGPLVTWTGALNSERVGAGGCGATGACNCASARAGTFPGAGTSGVLPLAPGEKILFDPIISSGTVVFTSAQFNTNECIEARGFVYGVRFDDCSVGVDTNNDGNVDDDKLELPSGGLLTAPVVNEETGSVYITNDTGTINSVAAATPQVAAQPMLKLWWREVLP